MKVQSTIFLADIKEAAPFRLEKLNSEVQIAEAATLLWDVLAASNQLLGVRLYRQTLPETKALLAKISELYGVYEGASARLVALLAVEDDSIERLAVVDSEQRQGLGRALMTFAKERLSAEYVDVYAENVPALRFFESCGLSMFDETTPEPGDLMASDPHPIIHLMY